MDGLQICICSQFQLLLEAPDLAPICLGHLCLEVYQASQTAGVLGKVAHHPLFPQNTCSSPPLPQYGIWYSLWSVEIKHFKISLFPLLSSSNPSALHLIFKISWLRPCLTFTLSHFPWVIVLFTGLPVPSLTALASILRGARVTFKKYSQSFRSLAQSSAMTFC